MSVPSQIVTNSYDYFALSAKLYLKSGNQQQFQDFVLKQSNLYRRKKHDDGSLFQCFSELMNVGENYQQQLKQLCIESLNYLMEYDILGPRFYLFKNNPQLYKDYIENQCQPFFDIINIELLSFVLQKQIIVYSFDESLNLNAKFFSNNFEKTLTIFKASDNTYQPLYNKSQMETLQIIRTFLTEIINQALSSQESNRKMSDQLFDQINEDIKQFTIENQNQQIPTNSQEVENNVEKQEEQKTSVVNQEIEQQQEKQKLEEKPNSAAKLVEEKKNENEESISQTIQNIVQNEQLPKLKKKQHNQTSPTVKQAPQQQQQQNNEDLNKFINQQIQNQNEETKQQTQLSATLPSQQLNQQLVFDSQSQQQNNQNIMNNLLQQQQLNQIQQMMQFDQNSQQQQQQQQQLPTQFDQFDQYNYNYLNEQYIDPNILLAQQDAMMYQQKNDKILEDPAESVGSSPGGKSKKSREAVQQMQQNDQNISQQIANKYQNQQYQYNDYLQSPFQNMYKANLMQQYPQSATIGTGASFLDFYSQQHQQTDFLAQNNFNQTTKSNLQNSNQVQMKQEENQQNLQNQSQQQQQQQQQHQQQAQKQQFNNFNQFDNFGIQSVLVSPGIKMTKPALKANSQDFVSSNNQQQTLNSKFQQANNQTPQSLNMPPPGISMTINQAAAVASNPNLQTQLNQNTLNLPFPQSLMTQTQLQQLAQQMNAMKIEKRKPLVIDETKLRYTGTVKFFDDHKCYGFMIMDVDNSEIFFHMDDIISPGLTKEYIMTYRSGNIIRFSFNCMTYIGKYNQSRKATDIQIIKYNNK